MSAQPGFVPHVATIGTGDRRALSLHCTMAFSGAWNGVSEAMPELMLIAPDMPSHGRSADWDGISDFGETVYQASLSVMDDGPMDVIGHSFGAVTALRLAVTHPERIRSLTVIEPVFFAISMQDAPQTMGHHDVASAPFKEAVAAGDMETAARTFNQMWGTGAVSWDSLPERTRAAMVRAIPVVPDTYGLLYDDAPGLLAADGLATVQVPTLLLRGEEAHPSVAAINDGLQARMPNASQGVVEGAGHMAPISHPKAVADAIRPFLERCT